MGRNYNKKRYVEDLPDWVPESLRRSYSYYQESPEEFDGPNIDLLKKLTLTKDCYRIWWQKEGQKPRGMNHDLFFGLLFVYYAYPEKQGKEYQLSLGERNDLYREVHDLASKLRTKITNTRINADTARSIHVDDIDVKGIRENAPVLMTYYTPTQMLDRIIEFTEPPPAHVKYKPEDGSRGFVRGFAREYLQLSQEKDFPHTSLQIAVNKLFPQEKLSLNQVKNIVTGLRKSMRKAEQK